MRGDLVAYVAEDSGFEEDGPRGLATFSGHVEDRAHPDAPWPSIGHAPLADAVRWARGHADKVIVRLSGWDQEFSAGAVSVGGLPPLPDDLELRPRRSAGWEFLDRTPQDEEIDWDVDVLAETFALVERPGIGLIRWWPQIRSALCADPRVVAVAAADLELPITQSNGAWSAHVHTQIATVRVRGRTVEEAGAAACSVLEGAAAVAGWEAPGGGPPAFTPAGAYPTGSRAAEANAGFENGTFWG